MIHLNLTAIEMAFLGTVMGFVVTAFLLTVYEWLLQRRDDNGK